MTPAFSVQRQQSRPALERLRVAIVAPEVFPVPPIRGGATETVIEEISSRLRVAETHIFGIADSALQDLERKDRRTYYRFRPRLLDRALLSHWRLPCRRSTSPWYYWPYSRWVAAHLRCLRPDAVWINSRAHFVLSARAASRAPVLLSLQNEGNLDGDAIWTSRMLASLAAVLPCSGSLKRHALSTRPALAEKLEVLHNGVDVARFAPHWSRPAERREVRLRYGLDDSPTVLFVGRLVPDKGVHLLIDAFARIADAFPKAVLLIAGAETFSATGDTPYTTELKRQAEPFGSRVRFLGYVPHAVAQQLFLASDVVAFPSIWREPFGMVVVEAMASGLPVVAFDQGGPAEVITHDKDGLLVPPGELGRGMAAALGVLLADTRLCNRLGREARRMVEQRFSWETLADRLETIILQSCGEAVAQ